MEFRVLGPVGAFAAGAPVELGERKQRLVLAVLLLEANQLVPVGRMVRLLWPDQPPPTSRRIVQTHVSRLRGSLAPFHDVAPEVRLTRSGEGYLLTCDPQRVDAHQFRSAVERARSSEDDRERVRILRAALTLWRGPALADVAEDDVRNELCAGLDESRLDAHEERFEAELRLGQNAVVDDLTELSARHPHRQRLVGQLMLALHQAGRTAEALRLYAVTRARLADELGLEPSAELQRLHMRILRSEVGSTATAAADRYGREPFRAAIRPPSRPCLLPADVPHFVGRGRYLAQLRRTLAPGRSPAAAQPILLVTGMPGVGKTALVTHWAHNCAAHFPDGQLYLDLRGYAKTAPLSEMEALTALLSGLGVTAEQLPLRLQDASALYRSLLAGRRMLLVLDDAPGPDAVRALLPGSAGCSVVVTSRNRMAGLVARNGAQRIELDPLDRSEALELVARTLGTPMTPHDAAAASRLVQLCGGLPLAIRIALAVAFDHGVDLTAQADAMTGAGLMEQLQIEGDEDASVPTAFGRSYARLPEPAATVFRQLGSAGPGSLAAASAASLTGVSLQVAQQALHQLVNANLLRPQSHNLFQVPELLRRYALTQLSPADVAAAAQKRTDERGMRNEPDRVPCQRAPAP